VKLRAPRLVAAVALAAAAGVARAAPPPPDALVEAEREIALLTERLAHLESEYGGSEEPAATRAARTFREGEARFLLGDWLGASVALRVALDVPELPAAERASGRWYLAESLFRQRRFAAALEELEALLAAPADEHAAEASVRAMACLVELGRHREVPAMLERARALHGGRPPPEALYLAAKATYRRADLPAAERRAAALAAFEAVPPPFDLAAAYFRGALHVQAGALERAAVELERCAAAEPADARQREIRELCWLAQGRVEGELGHVARALDGYARVPRESPRFDEALYESAWTYVKARRYDLALRSAGLVADAASGSPLAPRATLLQAHLALKTGRHGEAVETYERVVNAYAPVRDELDAILALHEDPLRVFDEVVHRGEGVSRPGNVLPPLVVAWAATQRPVEEALELVGAVEAARADLAGARAAADRVDAVLSRAWGLGAFPGLEEGHARAEAVENGAARLEGALSAAEARLHAPAFATGAAWLAATAERSAVEARLAELPRTPEEIEARVAGRRARAAALEKQAFALSYGVRACAAELQGMQAWLARHGAELGADRDARRELDAELRAQGEVVLEYERAVAALRGELSRVLDAIGRGSGSSADDAVRDEYRRKVATELELLAAARVGLEGPASARADAIEALRGRVAALQQGADQAKRRLLAQARTRADALRAQLAAERAHLAEEADALDSAERDVQEVVRAIATSALVAVRGELHRLVLKADVGIIDVAWTRKRERVDRIQALSAQEARDLGQLEDRFSGVLKEVE